MAVERPTYAVELRDHPYEIREYAPRIVAEVETDGTRGAAVSSGFRILAGYIFGGNQTSAKIAMTAPVMQTAVKPTAVSAIETPDVARTGWTVQFTMPRRYALNMLPTPNDGRVHLVEQPRQRVAALTFSGFWSDSNLGSHEAALLKWVKAQQLAATSTPSYAYYDPPWTPWFMRTIEVLVDVTPGQSP